MGTLSAAHQGLGEPPIALVSREMIARAKPHALAVALVAVLASLLWGAAPTLPANGRLALMVVGAAIIAWALTPANDTLVALTAAIAVVALGVTGIEEVHGALGHEMVWLLIASFVVAAVLRASGVLEIAMHYLLRPFATIAGLAYGLTGVIALTAFLVPSTSGRAALLLPVYLDLVRRIPDPRLTRPLALIFPTAILLSAGGSLIGAGAHLIAVDYIAKATAIDLNFVTWIALALPFALASTLASTFVILHLFVPADLHRARIVSPAAVPAPLTGGQRAIAAIVVLVVLLWITSPLHGLHITLVAMAAMVLMLAKPISGVKPKEAFKSVEIELLIFLAATLVLADALQKSGADRWLASGIVVTLGETVPTGSSLIVAATAVVALAAHLVITSRTARAAVLVPAVAVPFSALGHDALQLVMVTVLGTGFCQTLRSSSKPVAIFASADVRAFESTDLVRLSAWLMPMLAVMLTVYGTLALPALKELAFGGDRPAVVASLAKPVADRQALPATSAPVCADHALLLLMKSTIFQNRLYASGWWQVWHDLSRAGIGADRQAVRRLYREHDLVALRARSPERVSIEARAAELAGLRVACAAPRGRT